MDDRLFNSIYAKYLKDSRIITGLMPAEHRSLSELLEEEKPSVRLRDGSTHLFRREELEKLASSIPWYMHPLVKLPLVIVKDGDSYRLMCDRWCLRAAFLALNGELSFNPPSTLSARDVGKLVEMYGSLVFITIRTGENASGGIMRREQ